MYFRKGKFYLYGCLSHFRISSKVSTNSQMFTLNWEDKSTQVRVQLTGSVCQQIVYFEKAIVSSHFRFGSLPPGSDAFVSACSFFQAQAFLSRIVCHLHCRPFSFLNYTQGLTRHTVTYIQDRQYRLCSPVQSENVGPWVKTSYEFQDGHNRTLNQVWGPSEHRSPEGHKGHMTTLTHVPPKHTAKVRVAQLSFYLVLKLSFQPSQLPITQS